MSSVPKVFICRRSRGRLFSERICHHDQAPDIALRYHTYYSAPSFLIFAEEPSSYIFIIVATGYFQHSGDLEIFSSRSISRAISWAVDIDWIHRACYWSPATARIPTLGPILRKTSKDRGDYAKDS